MGAAGLARGQGMRPLLGPQPIYILPTSALFFLFGSSDFLARFIPALTGSALILVPYLFRERIKPVPGLAAGLLPGARPGPGLAFAPGWEPDPCTDVRLAGLGLLVAGTSAGGGSLCRVGFALGAVRLGGIAWAGIGLDLTSARWRGRLPGRLRRQVDETEAGKSVESVRREDLKAALMFGGATILLGGTMFLLSPNGLSAWLNALPEYLAGWVRPSGVPAGRLLFALLVYQPLAVLFGLVAVVRGWWGGRAAQHALEPVAADGGTAGAVLPGASGG